MLDEDVVHQSARPFIEMRTPAAAKVPAKAASSTARPTAIRSQCNGGTTAVVICRNYDGQGRTPDHRTFIEITRKAESPLRTLLGGRDHARVAS